MKTNSLIYGFLTVVLISISGCGGGGGGNPEPNQSPTVSVESVTGNESAEITLSATASDPDGSIASFAWTQTSGPSVDLTGANTNSATFIAPAIDEETTLAFNVVVTDNDNATANASVTVTVNPIMINLGIQGKASVPTGTGIAVSIEIGETHLAANVDENDNFQADISLDESMAESVVVVTVVGTDVGSPIKLRSYLGTLQSLVDEAGDDHVLNSNELLALNVDSITTATAALMEDSNSGNAITSQAEFAYHSRMFNTYDLINMSRIVEFVLRYSEDFPSINLPDGISNSSALVENYNAFVKYYSATQAYSSDYASSSRAKMDDLYEDLVVDGAGYSFKPQNASISIADDYYFINQIAESSLGRISLAENGTGELINGAGKIAINWSSSELGVEVTYQAGDVLESVETTFDPNLYAFVEIQHMSRGVVLRWFNHTQDVDQMITSKSVYRHYPNGEYADSEPTTEYSFPVAVRSAGTVNATTVLKMDQEFVLPVGHKYEDIDNAKVEYGRFGPLYHDRSSATMVFHGDLENGGIVDVTRPTLDGEGLKSETVVQLPWKIDNQGKLLIVDSNTYSYVFTNDADNYPSFANMASIGDGPAAVSGDPVAGGQDAEWDIENITGIYKLPEYLYDGDYVPYIQYIWIELYQDGTALTVYAVDAGEEGEDVSEMPGMWQLNAAGEVVVRRYRRNGIFGYCTPNEWDPADNADCVLYHERTWDLFQVTDDAQHFINQTHKYFDDSNRAASENPDVEGHILSRASTLIVSWIKVPQAPFDVSELKSSATSNKSNSKNVNKIFEKIEKLNF